MICTRYRECLGGLCAAVVLWSSAPAAGQVIWTTPEPVNRFPAQVLSAAYAPDGAHLALGLSDGTILLWNVSTGEETLRIDGHNRAVRSVAYSPDGGHVVSGSNDRTVRLWNAATGAEVRRFDGHGGHVNSVALST